MKKILLQHLFFVFAISGLFSCSSDDEDLNTKGIPKNVKVIELKIQNQQLALEKPMEVKENNALDDPLNENKIENISIYIFKQDGTLQKEVSSGQYDKKTLSKTGFNLRIFIPNNEAAEYQGENFQICIVANHQVELKDIHTLEQLQQTIEQTKELNNGKPMNKFLMSGVVETEIYWSENQLVFTVAHPLLLIRAASKIRLRIENISINIKGVDYIVEGTPRVKLMNYTDKSGVLKGDIDITSLSRNNTEYQLMKKESNDIGKASCWTTHLPYYSYENDWSKDLDNETYFLIQLNLHADDEDSKPFYYRIPVNYRMPLQTMSQEVAENIHKLQRNHYYEVITSIEVLGNEDESNPLLLEAGVAVEPWVLLSDIDGNIYNAHYLVVKEKYPVLLNTDFKEVSYLSDLPVKVTIDSIRYEIFNRWGERETYVASASNPLVINQYINGYYKRQDIMLKPMHGATVVVDDETDISDKKLIIKHVIPNNYVPFYIYITVTQIKEYSDGTTPLTEQVVAIQYPPKYVTGEKSPGYTGGTSNVKGADFRFMSLLGALTETGTRVQANEIFYKITTSVNSATERIGDPTDKYGRTKPDRESNRLVSPQFIIATQNGMSRKILQYQEEPYPIYTSLYYGQGYGPFSNRFKGDGNGVYFQMNESVQPYYRFYENAGDRCDKYFEGEYGLDGVYKEYYLNKVNYHDLRDVRKTFKYKGRWRIPTSAELELINRIQSDRSSVVKYLLMGENYWSAERWRLYNFSENLWMTANTYNDRGYVRCVFDTYKYED